MSILKVRVQPEQGESFNSSINMDGVIGRHPSSAIILYGDEVSLAHARVWELDGEWFIADLNSGACPRTLVDGAGHSGRLHLSRGSVIEIGRSLIRVEAIEEEVGSSTPSSADPLRQKIEYVRKRVFHDANEFIKKERRISNSVLTSYLERAIRQAFGLTESEPLTESLKNAVDELRSELVGLGPFDALLSDQGISEIMVNGSVTIAVERDGRLELSPQSFSSQEAVRTVVERILLPHAVSLNEQRPIAQVKLADGSRFHVVIPPVSQHGTIVTIRKFRKQLFDLEALMARGFMPESVMKLLKQMIISRRNIFICGATGAGKTTLLNALLKLVSSSERLVILEDHAEIAVDGLHVIRLEAKGSYRVRDLLIEALRMRPDRIIVGECRGEESVDMIQAMNTGHLGSMTTLHANSPRDMMARLIALLARSMMNMDHSGLIRQLATAVDVIVQLESRVRDDRRIVSIHEVRGLEGQTFVLNALYEANHE